MLPKSTAFLGFSAIFALFPTSTHAVLTGDFPGLGVLIEKSDAIVVAGIVRQVQLTRINGWSSHDCRIFKTLKGEIPSGESITLLLREPRFMGGLRFPLDSVHLIFLAKKEIAHANGPNYQTLSYKGANIRLSQVDDKTMDGKTVAEEIRAIVKRAMEHNRKVYNREHEFLEQVIK